MRAKIPLADTGFFTLGVSTARHSNDNVYRQVTETQGTCYKLHPSFTIPFMLFHANCSDFVGSPASHS